MSVQLLVANEYPPIRVNGKAFYFPHDALLAILKVNPVSVTLFMRPFTVTELAWWRQALPNCSLQAYKWHFKEEKWIML